MPEPSAEDIDGGPSYADRSGGFRRGLYCPPASATASAPAGNRSRDHELYLAYAGLKAGIEEEEQPPMDDFSVDGGDD